MAEANKSVKKKGISPFRICFSAALGLLIALLALFGRFEAFENRWQDWMHLHRGMRQADPRIVLVTVDEQSIKEIGTYPWPRSRYAPLIENLKKMGVKTVGFDVLFLEPSRPSEDEPLIQSTKRAGNVVHAAEIDLLELERHLNKYLFVFPFGALRKASVGLGLVNMVLIDDDGAVRRAPLMLGTSRETLDPESVLKDEERLPTLGLAVLSAYEGKAPEDYVRRHGFAIHLNLCGQREWEEPHPSGAVVNGEPLMVTKRAFGFPRISAIDVIRDRLSPEDRARFKGSMVLVGSTAVGAFDHYPTPFSAQAPGVEVHANVIDNLLQNNYLKSVPRIVNFLLVLAFPFLAVFLIGLSPLMGSLVAAGMILGWLAFDYFLFLNGIRAACIAPAVGLGLGYVVLLVQRMLVEQKEKRWIKGTFGQYLSPKVVEILMADPDKLKLGGEKRDMSVFFLDIAHFTTISEKMDPESLTHFLNKYLTALTNVILKNDGVVDKYIGDCVMAFWNAPLDQPRHREFACLSAIECIEAIERLNKELVGDEIPEKPAIRIGLNAGECVVGNMGSETRFSYTVIGDVVNLASRLEGANKFFGSNIMASENVFGPIRDKFEARELGQVRVVGKAIPIRVYEIWGRAGALPPEKKQTLDLFQEGQKLFFERRFEEAANRFQKIQAAQPGDKVAKIYLSAAQDYSLLPPPDDWDGVFNLTSK